MRNDYLLWCTFCHTKIHNQGLKDGRYIWKTDYCCSKCFQKKLEEDTINQKGGEHDTHNKNSSK